MWSYFKLILWGAVWFMAWAITLFWRRNRENCLTWAVKKWDNDGGYLVIRWCRSNALPWLRWPHFLWLSERHEHLLEHVIPEEPPNAQHIIPKPWFEPVQKMGDSADQAEN